MVLDERLPADAHVAQRIRRARGAFYGLTPLGLLTNWLNAADKIYLWKSVILPALVFGRDTAPLSPSDIERLDARGPKGSTGQGSARFATLCAGH